MILHILLALLQVFTGATYRGDFHGAAYRSGAARAQQQLQPGLCETISSPETGSVISIIPCGAVIVASGIVGVPPGANGVIVVQPAVTQSNRIFLQLDTSLGPALSVTCDQGISVPLVTSRTPGVGFTLSLSGPPVEEGCFSYFITS